MNYRILITFDQQNNLFRAHTPELEHCAAEAPSRAEAVAQLEQEIKEQIKVMAEHGRKPPVCIDDSIWNGELHAKVSSNLHKELVWQSRKEGISLDQYVAELLTQAIDSKRHSTESRQPRQNDPNSRQSQDRFNRRNPAYNAEVMEDRAHFIQYLRNGDSTRDNRGANDRSKPRHQQGKKPARRFSKPGAPRPPHQRDAGVSQVHSKTESTEAPVEVTRDVETNKNTSSE